MVKIQLLLKKKKNPPSVCIFDGAGLPQGEDGEKNKATTTTKKPLYMSIHN